MKIRIIQDGNVIKVYHHPREVIIKPKQRHAIIGDTDPQEYFFKQRNLYWIEDKDLDNAEIGCDIEIQPSVEAMNLT